MKAPHAVVSIPVFLTGGTEYQTLSLVAALKKGGYGVTLLCCYDWEEGMIGEARAAGAKVRLLEARREEGLFSLGVKLVRAFRELAPDFVHVQYIAPGLVPVMAARIAGVSKVFATVHQSGRAYGGWEKFLIRRAAGLCRAFVGTSKAVEESWFGGSAIYAPGMEKKRKHFTVYNAVDVEKVNAAAGEGQAEAARSLGLEGKTVVGVVGSLKKIKGHALLVEAMAEVKKSLPGAVLLVIGDGPEKENLMERAGMAGLAGDIRWLGRRRREDVYRLYGAMDVLAVPSKFEGFGLAAAEAMAAGLPVVATRVDGLTEVGEDGMTGFLTPPGDAGEMSRALVRVLRSKDRGREMGRRGKERVSRLFSQAAFEEKTLRLYRAFGLAGHAGPTEAADEESGG